MHMIELLKKELELRGWDVVDALVRKGENGDVSAIKLMFELTKSGGESAGPADLSSYTDAMLLRMLKGE